VIEESTNNIAAESSQFNLGKYVLWTCISLWFLEKCISWLLLKPKGGVEEVLINQAAHENTFVDLGDFMNILFTFWFLNVLIIIVATYALIRKMKQTGKETYWQPIVAIIWSLLELSPLILIFGLPQFSAPP